MYYDAKEDRWTSGPSDNVVDSDSGGSVRSDVEEPSLLETEGGHKMEATC